MRRRIDPLWWFLGAGAAIFVLAAFIDPDGADDASVIRVDRPVLEAYLATGGGNGLSETLSSGPMTLDDLSPQARQELVDRYVEEEALFREARSWGLDQDDPAIRRRLGQSMRFALRPDVAADPGDAQLRKFFDANRADYAESDLVTFEHIFFDATRGGADGAAQRARAFSPDSDWQGSGDRFAYQRTYVGARSEEVAAQLGRDFADAVFALNPSDAWQGPIRSDLGAHLVRVVRHNRAGEPDFAALRPIVLDDWMRARQAGDLEKRIDAIVSSYEAKVAPEFKSDER